ncbi:fimbrillin family protein [Leyella stercorea]|uniref:fimbrillin family protein n=1 Tax=Leyella stercorea TaxID=363265 RepID=UPI002430D302|nr:fimbrillin family protein [Leyella stercorea]
MKKILYSVFMLATMVLAACSSEDTTEPDVKRGMVLKANVEDTDTRATITDNEGKWKFAFAKDDMVKVGNDEVESYYTFTNNGTVFESTDALQTTAAANWYAYFPSETIDLRNQSGAFADVAKNYALAGVTATPTTGSDGLTVTMKAKAAVLCIVGVKNGESLDINVQTAKGKYVSGLTAVKHSADFRVETSDKKVTLLSKPDAGVYYVVVPAGVKLSVYNGETLIKKTKENGLTAGKYYTLTTHDTTGSATNKSGETIDWVQLWPGGPKFATKNVAEELDWYEATKPGADYAWGENWRTPTAEEVYGEGKLYALPNENNHYQPVAGSPYFKIIKEGEYITLVFTGVQPGYTKNTLTLYNKSGHGNYNFDFWTSSEISGYGKRFNISAQDAETEGFEIGYFWISPFDNKKTKYLVRPVLAK